MVESKIHKNVSDSTDIALVCHFQGLASSAASE